MTVAEVAMMVLGSGLFAAACGATYWGGQVSAGMRQLQGVTKDHEERLREAGY